MYICFESEKFNTTTKEKVQCSRVILYPVMNIIHYEFQFILQNAYYTDNKVNELFSVRKGKN